MFCFDHYQKIISLQSQWTLLIFEAKQDYNALLKISCRHHQSNRVVVGDQTNQSNYRFLHHHHSIIHIKITTFTSIQCFVGKLRPYTTTQAPVIINHHFE